jgi:carbonic anhydrase
MDYAEESAKDLNLTRRSLLTGMAAAAVSPWAFAYSAGSGHAGGSGSAAGTTKSAHAAFDALVNGNKRFAAGQATARTNSASRRADLVSGQSPFAIVLACSDSRVAPESVFDQGLGDLFVVRVAGNVVATDVLGSVEYAVLHLNSPLIFVMGHQKCGAVAAALAAKEGKLNEPPHITELIALITPGLTGLNMQQTPDALLEDAIVVNVRYTLEQLRRAPEISRMLSKKSLGIAGGVYQLASGEVKILDQSIPA